MNLSKHDVDLFYKLHLKLLTFIELETHVLSLSNPSPDKIMSQPLEERIKLRNRLCKNKDLISKFLETGEGQNLSEEEKKIVQSWQFFEQGSFVIYKYLKNHSLFLQEKNPAKVYGVHGIFDLLEDIIPSYTLPHLIETVLLPFKDKIIYDGLIQGYSIFFGSGIKSDLKACYEKAKHNFGVITELPFNESKENDDAKNLKFYLKNNTNREIYWEEIIDLSRKNKNLTSIYYQEMGRINARRLSKELKRLGVKKVWFGVLDNTIVASGPTKTRLKENIDEVFESDSEKKKIYIFNT